MKITTAQRKLLDSLAGTQEIADALGTSRGQVAVWSQRQHINGFPDPLIKVSAGRFWHLPDVIEWHKTYTPATGGRPKVKK